MENCKIFIALQNIDFMKSKYNINLITTVQLLKTKPANHQELTSVSNFHSKYNTKDDYNPNQDNKQPIIQLQF